MSPLFSFLLTSCIYTFYVFIDIHFLTLSHSSTLIHHHFLSLSHSHTSSHYRIIQKLLQLLHRPLLRPIFWSLSLITYWNRLNDIITPPLLRQLLRQPFCLQYVQLFRKLKMLKMPKKYLGTCICGWAPILGAWPQVRGPILGTPPQV